MENIKETIAKLEKGLDNPYITDDIKVKISEKIAELKAELEPKPAPIPEPIAVVETKVEPTLDDLTKRLGIVNKMAAKNPALKARVKIIEKMIEKAKKGVISHKSKIKIGDIVANKKHKTIGIVRDIYGGEFRTDADGVVDIDDLEIYSPSKHNEYHIAPSTKKEITETIGYKIVKTLGGFGDGLSDEKAILDSYSDIIPQLTRAAAEPFDRVELQKLIVKITGNPDVSSDLEILRKHKVLDLDVKNNKPESNKLYNIQQNIGKAKYVVNYHDGVKTHKDGSAFYDISIFKNKKDLENFIKKLESEGYKEKFENGGEITSEYYIHEGHDHFKNKPLFRVESSPESDNEYVGEWHDNKIDAETELKSMQKNKNQKIYEVFIDMGNEGTRTIADFETEKEAKNFIYEYNLKHPNKKLGIDTITSDFIMANGGEITNKITVYRFHPMLIWKGGGYPLQSVDLSLWNKNKNHASALFNNFNTNTIEQEELQEIIDSNEFGDDKTWILATIESAEVPLSVYNEYLKSMDDELINNAADYDFKTIKEKTFMPNGEKVPNVLYKTIYKNGGEVRVGEYDNSIGNISSVENSGTYWHSRIESNKSTIRKIDNFLSKEIDNTKEAFNEQQEARNLKSKLQAENLHLMDNFGGSKEYEVWVKNYDEKNELPFEKGGSVWIQKATKQMEKKGTKGLFTERAEARGLTAVEFAKKVLANPNRYTKTIQKEAQFVKNTNPELFN